MSSGRFFSNFESKILSGVNTFCLFNDLIKPLTQFFLKSFSNDSPYLLKLLNFLTEFKNFMIFLFLFIFQIYICFNEK